MSKSNYDGSNSILNEEKDDLEGKGRDLAPGASTPCLTKDDMLTVDDGNIGGENGITSSPERREVKREGITGAISMRGARPPPPPDSRVWAVLIGIDGYKTHPLSGCVSDARLMEDYLINYVKIDKTHIQCLLGPSGPGGKADPSGDSLRLPTRKNIVETLLGIASNGLIQRDDDIIIYYAGHGASYRDPGRPSTETLCPIDRDGETRNHDISDREINAILHRISCSKGNRITVILDCCYSGSATRGDSHPREGRFRSVPPLANVSAESTLRTGDRDLNRSTSHPSLLDNGWRPIMDSHVILAACLDTQRARETSGSGSEGCNGVFTMALLHALKSTLLTQTSTYMDLLNILVVEGQKPVLAGSHKHSELGRLIPPRW